MSEREEQLPLEKILTVSAAEYCASVGKQLSDYNVVGVHSYSDNNHHPSCDKPVDESFLRSLPKGAEVIVEYRCSIAAAATATSGQFSTNHNYLYISTYGTALIPKNRQDTQK